MGNAAFLVLVGAKGETGAERDRLVCWAHGQLQYALGDAGGRVDGWMDARMDGRRGGSSICMYAGSRFTDAFAL
jgi:hypothetical protein